MELDNLQEMWQSQKINKPIFNHENMNTMISKIEKERKAIYKENLLTSFGMIPALIVVVTVFAIFPDRNFLFYASLALILILMIGIILIQWSRLVNWQDGAIIASNKAYIDQTIRKLNFQKTFGKWILPGYNIILGIAMAYYLFDILDNLTLNTRIIAITVISVLILLYTVFKRNNDLLKIKNNIQPIIEDLKKWQLTEGQEAYK